MKKNIGIAAMLLIYSNVSFAICTNSDLSGVWKLFGTIEFSIGERIPFVCNLNMPAKGNIIKTDSTCSSASNNYDRINFSGTTLSGTLTVDSKCHVTGQFSINIGKMSGTLDPTSSIAGIQVIDVERKAESKVDAFISKGKDSISGMMYESAFTPPIFINGLSPLAIHGIAVSPTELTWSSVFTGVKP